MTLKLTKKIPFSFLILIISFLSNCNSVFAQWVYPELKNLKTDINILYDVIYEKELTAEQKKHPLIFVKYQFL